MPVQKQCQKCGLEFTMRPDQKYCRECKKAMKAEFSKKYFLNRYKTDPEFKARWNRYINDRKKNPPEILPEPERNRIAGENYDEYHRVYMLIKPILKWELLMKPGFIDVCKQIESDYHFRHRILQVVFDDIATGIFRGKIPDTIELKLSDIKTGEDQIFDVI